MAKFITTKRISSELEDLIKNAEGSLFLASYNFEISDTYLNRLKSAIERGVKIYIVYGIGITEENLKVLESLPNVQIRYLKYLHAKVFINEKSCIVSSMNFSYASERNGNWECGVLIHKKDDPEMYEEASAEIKEIYKTAVLKQPLISKLEKQEIKTFQIPKEAKGFCIRCKSNVDLDIDKPLCKKCFNIWIKYEDWDYEEEYCHGCGKSHDSSYAKPFCKSCYNKY